MKTRIRSLIMAMLLVLSLTVTSMAAGTGSDAGITLYAEQVSDQIVLYVYLTAKDSTNGRIVIDYDYEQLKLAGASTNDAWVTSVNASTAGEVSFAWVGSSTAASSLLVTLNFSLLEKGPYSVDFGAEMAELYKSGVDVLGSKTIRASLTISSSYTGSEGTNPLPPADPQPSDPTPGEDEEKPGINIEVPELTEARYNAIVEQYPDAEDHWAEENIVKAINAGLFNGTGANTFTPDGVVTRGMFVTLLYRLSGEPEVDGKMSFTDVPANQYYANAVIWASSNGIVNGVTDTEFAPDQEVSREQMVTMLYRFAKASGADVSEKTGLKGFGDSADVSSWAAEAMSWAVAEGIITGSAGNLNPADDSTRAQIATVLVRYAGL